MTEPDLVGDSYTYGERIGSLEWVAKELKRDPNSNRAVISLWRSEDNGSSNPPCMISVGFQIRQGQIHTRAVFRSHDIGYGWFPNSYALIMLTRNLRNLLQDPFLELGDLTVISESAHIYQSAAVEVSQFLKTYKPRGLQVDPVGNFVIRCVAMGEVIIDHYKYGVGTKIRSYRTVQEVLDSNPKIDVAHYGYLCTEFIKASIQGKYYTQDLM